MPQFMTARLPPRLIILLTAAALLLVGTLAALVVVFGGLYDVSANRQHTRPVYALLEIAMRQSVPLRARDIQPPPLDDPALVSRGAACFAEKCVQCHGAPGVAQGSIGQSMQPLPGPLVDATQRWRPRELYWLTRNGLKMTGMPAWEFHLEDRDLWAVVAFLGQLPATSPQGFAEMTAQLGSPQPSGEEWRAAASGKAHGASRICGRSQGALPPSGAAGGGDIQRGQRAMFEHACSACHAIPGVTGAAGAVGPPLRGIARRTLIAGKLANTQENMVRWLQDPKAIDPLTAMPAMGIDAETARDMAAYLSTLD